MLKMKIFTCLLGVLSFSFMIGQEIDRTKAPEPSKAPKINLGEPQKFQLENGLKVFLVEDHQLPQLAMNLIIHKDPHMETGYVGLSGMMGDMMSAGTKNRSKSEIDEAIDFVGASLYTFSNGFYFSCLSKHAKTVTEIASDILINPVFPKEELEKKLKRQRSNLKSLKSNPNAISNRLERVLKYGENHPYGEIQRAEDIDNITVELCKRYHDTYFKPNIGYLVIVGDIDLSGAKSLCENYFGSWQKGDVPSHEVTFPEKPKGVQVSFVHKPGAVQSLIKVFYPVSFKIGDENTAQTDVMSNILGGSFSSYLNANLREDKGYTYGSRGRVRADRYVGSFSASASVRNEVTDSSVTEMLFEMNRIRKELVDEKDLSRVKNNMIGDFALSLENQQTIARYALNVERYNLPQNYYRDMLDKVQNVNVNMIKEAANQFIDPENCHILVVGNKDIADKLVRFDSDQTIDYYDYNAFPVKMDAKPLPEGLTAEKVIHKYVMAQTSSNSLDEAKKKFKSIKSYKKQLSATIEAQGQSFSMEMTEMYKSHAYYKAETIAMGMTVQSEVINPKNGGQMNMQMGKKSYSSDELKSKIHDHRLDKDLYYEENGETIELVAIENALGEECYVVKRQDGKGKSSTEFYSTNSGLLIQNISQQESEKDKEPATSTVQFSDYKDIDGFKYPSKLTMDINGNPMEINVSKMELNCKIKKSEFSWED